MVQNGRGVGERSFIGVMKDAVSPHPSTDQDEEPGRRAGEQVLVEAGAFHKPALVYLDFNGIQYGESSGQENQGTGVNQTSKHREPTSLVGSDRDREGESNDE